MSFLSSLTLGVPKSKYSTVEPPTTKIRWPTTALAHHTRGTFIFGPTMRVSLLVSMISTDFRTVPQLCPPITTMCELQQHNILFVPLISDNLMSSNGSRVRCLLLKTIAANRWHQSVRYKCFHCILPSRICLRCRQQRHVQNVSCSWMGGPCRHCLFRSVKFNTRTDLVAQLFC